MDKVQKFLNDIYSANSALEDVTDIIFDTIDNLLCNNSFDECDLILKTLDVHKIPTDTMRSFLTITFAAKNSLPSRPDLFKRIKEEMIIQKGAEMTERLIGRLK